MTANMGVSARLGRRTLALGLSATVAVVVTAAVPQAFGGTAAAVVTWDRIEMLHGPSHLPPGGEGVIAVTPINGGDQASDGTETLTVSLPPGISVRSAAPVTGFWDCSATVAGTQTVSCTETAPIKPGVTQGSQSVVNVRVAIDPGLAGTVPIRATISGGGAATPTNTTYDVVVSARPVGFGVRSFSGEVRADAAGAPATSAGSHPFSASTTIMYETAMSPDGWLVPAESFKTIRVDLPPGFVGNPNALAKCTEAQLAASTRDCPGDSQVGFVRLIGPNGPIQGNFPVFNMVAPDGVPGMFGFNAIGTIVHMNASVRSGSDYGLTITVPNISQALPLVGTSLTFWGVPNSPAHDSERGLCLEGWERSTSDRCPSRSAPSPFLTNPTDCSAGLLTTSLATDSWARPGTWHRSSFDHDVNGVPMKVEHCEKLPFSPTISVVPSTRQRTAPAGYTVTLGVPQNENPVGLATAHVRSVSVTLPPGTVLSPSSADGLRGCSEADVALRSTAPSTCPPASQIGRVQIDTPLLDEPMRGAVYLAEQSRNPFGSLLAIYLVAEGPGVIVKLAGHVSPDPLTGQLTTTFDGNPPLPFSRFVLAFKGGSRAPLVNPSGCGIWTTSTRMTSFGGNVATPSDAFFISQDGAGAPCAPETFAPSLDAGMTDTAAGSASTFTLTFSRTDGDQLFKDVAVSMPPGLVGRIADVDLCSDRDATAGSCPETSRIGSAVTVAGPGPTPFSLPGRVYMTDGYKGAPFGLSIVVPAVAGPFDLGTVVVRAAVFVDRSTAALSVVSDPLPAILQGIPLFVRTVNVAIDRSGFMLNPTNCTRRSIDARIGSTAGSNAAVGSRFQVGSCAALPFHPKMSLRVGKKGRTRPGITVPFRAVVGMTPGQANIRSVRVNLPRNINARLPVINNNACPLSDYESGRCPERLAVGSATAVTPLLKDPLRGKAYFVRNPARRIPDLVVALKGQVDVDLVGKVTIPRNLTLATTFDTVPDVPITKFALNLVAGRSGPIGTIGNLCAKRVRKGMKAKLVFRGQNGSAISRSQRMQIFGCRNVKVKAKGKKGKAHHGRRGASKKGRRGGSKTGRRK